MIRALDTTTLTPPPDDQLGVLTSTLPVVLTAQQVTVDAAMAEQLAARWAEQPWPLTTWDRQTHFYDGTAHTLNWIALLDALNFCFWGEPGQARWRVYWRGNWYNGYMALAIALSRAVADGQPLWDAAYLARLTPGIMNAILRPDPDEAGVAVPIPLLAERLAHARELGQIVMDHYDGRFSTMIDAADHDAVRLTLLIAAECASFRDIAMWEGQEVRFYKRAQILVSDIATAFPRHAWGSLQQMDRLTIFADYKLPQILRHLGVITYTPDLAHRIDEMTPIIAGSPDEIAIRAATVWACELIRQALSRRGIERSAPAIDYRLWFASQQQSAMAPYHRTRTIYY